MGGSLSVLKKWFFSGWDKESRLETQVVPKRPDHRAESFTPEGDFLKRTSAMQGGFPKR
jgi:hypothetical protein